LYDFVRRVILYDFGYFVRRVILYDFGYFVR